MKVEVTNITAQGVWIFIQDRELFMSNEDFPWFKDRPVKSTLNVEKQAPGLLYWPDIDVDLSEEIIQHPERYPLTSK